VLVPVAVVLAPLYAVHGDAGALRSEDIEWARTQVYVHEKYEATEAAGFRLVGPAIYPHSIEIEIDGARRVQEVHELDLTNLYSISREWAMGSCPHLFLRNAGTCGYHYWGELFANALGQLREEQLDVPAWADEIVIAEFRGGDHARRSDICRRHLCRWKCKTEARRRITESRVI